MTKLFALFVLWTADLVTTLIGLHNGAREIAPVAAAMLAAGGLTGLVLFPIPLHLIQLGLLRSLQHHPLRKAGWAVTLAVSLVPVINNTLIILDRSTAR